MRTRVLLPEILFIRKKKATIDRSPQKAATKQPGLMAVGLPLGFLPPGTAYRLVPGSFVLGVKANRSSYPTLKTSKEEGRRAPCQAATGRP